MPQDVLFLPISGPRGASSRYRVFQFLPAIASAGITYSVHLPPGSPGRGIGRLLTSLRERREIAGLARSSRSVFVQKRLLPESRVVALAGAEPLLFDFDDALFTSPTGRRSRLAQRRVEGRLRQVLSSARLVTAGNRYLCDFAAQFSRQVIHLPTVVDGSRYPAKRHLDRSEVVVGWIGHSVNHPYLRDLADVLQRLAMRCRMRLLVVSDRDFAIPGVPVENRRWSEGTEVEDILGMDIGIMPMPDDAWARGKCGLKAIQYMAAGIPVVCAAVGANIEIVRNGIDGFCASSPPAWVDNLSELCSSVDLRHRMGLAGRQRVQENYSLAGMTPLFLDALVRLCRA